MEIKIYTQIRKIFVNMGAPQVCFILSHFILLHFANIDFFFLQIEGLWQCCIVK